ncbi:MAG: type I DNA topoisomerase [Candidatus Komeilibacteria bacterium]|nr:type I DNA topoisomerase [Candidatus Komeilibacteria bacterium]
MTKKLIIVESPTKAKTISKFLGKDWDVQSSFGHVRDLPKSDLGIDVENDFVPKYVIPTKARKAVNLLKKKAEKVKEVYLSTDEDREGEAIALNLTEALKLKEEVIRRVAFHEITATAVKEAIDSPREIDLNLVDAQQARRILDRLVGYKLSPWLWKKVAKGLSAGRVQSVALRLVVEREREIQAFKPEEYWKIVAEFVRGDKYPANLVAIDGKNLDKMAIKDAARAEAILADLKNSKYHISRIEKKDETKNPPSPLTTSLLQQEANRRFGYSSKQTMMIAQQLYEGIEVGGGQEGLITYMRTDSQNLSQKFLEEARDYVKQKFGGDYIPEKARLYRTKSKGAQEAHEAIRPTEVSRTPESIKDFLEAKQYRLYKMIWERSVASQMTAAKVAVTNLYINDKSDKYTFGVNGAIIKFLGYLAVYQNYSINTILPDCQEGEAADLQNVQSQQNFTKPPARYSDAGLVRQLEKRGIGRPSTYAPIISTIIERNYVRREEKRLQPTEIGFVVNDRLVEHFPQIVDYGFTAQMEEDFDNIADGDQKWQPVIKNFYDPFALLLEKKYSEVSKDELIEQTDVKCEKCGGPMIIKMARFGKFMACANFPECRFTKSLDDDSSESAYLEEKCPDCGGRLMNKQGRFGKFAACENYPECKFTRNTAAKTGVKCPECDKGELAQKRTKRGRIFYGCDNYPNCKFALWDKPLTDKCPKCKSILVEKKNEIKCSNTECDYSMPKE